MSKFDENLPISNPKPDLHNMNARTKFGENPLMFIIWKLNMDGHTTDGWTDRWHTDVQNETTIPRHYAASDQDLHCLPVIHHFIETWTVVTVYLSPPWTVWPPALLMRTNIMFSWKNKISTIFGWKKKKILLTWSYVTHGLLLKLTGMRNCDDCFTFTFTYKCLLL